MRVLKSLRYLRLIFILFNDILIYSRVLKNTLTSMELNTMIQEKTSLRTPTSNIERNYFIL